MSEIYWITRLGALDTLCEVVLFLTGLFFVLILALYPPIHDYLDDHEEQRARLIKAVKLIAVLCVLAIIGKVFIPTQKELLLIYGIGGTIDYVQSSDKAKELPDKAVEALGKYLEEASKDE